jgi:hypothetical protein
MTIIKILGMLFSKKSGRFPITSNRGNMCVVIFYIYDAIFVKSVPIKSQSKEELLRAYRLVYAYLTVQGFKPQLYKMDNKMSHDVETFICKKNTHLQYTPPNINRTNPMEWDICTWKNTSSPASLGFQRPSQLQIGVVSLTKQTSPSICYGHAIKILLYMRSRHLKDPTCLMQHRWLH